MQIEGLGKELVEQLVEKKMVSDLADIYYLTFDELAALERKAEKSATNLLQQIEQSKQRELSRLIYALGIRHVGERTARVLAEHFGSLDALAAASEEELSDIFDIGKIMASAISEWFSIKSNRQLLERLRKAGIEFEHVETVKAKKIFSGKQFVLTGKLQNLFPASIKLRLVGLAGGS